MNIIKTNIKLTTEEKETHVSFDMADGMWHMDSSIPRHFNKAVNAGWEPIAQYIDKDGIVYRMRLRAAERGITIKTPEKRKVSQEHLDKLRVGLENSRVQNKDGGDVE